MGSARLFDLNVEEVLEHWEVHHAIREVIANALDEQVLTDTDDIRIYRDDASVVHIRDFGRGLRIDHLTLNESQEKIASDRGVIGKFGVGLKDALATFHRRRIGVEIVSPHGVFRLRKSPKHGFADISTLHVELEPTAASFVGTDVRLTGVSASDLQRAERLFLRFSGVRILESTDYGAVIAPPPDGPPQVYINGVLANEEPNFLFSYNVTSLTAGMKRRLNRERLNVSRTTYGERIRSILKAARGAEVKNRIAAEVRRRAEGTQHDELQWIEIASLALNYLHEQAAVAYVTEEETYTHPDIVDHMRRDGLDAVVVTGQQKEKLRSQVDSGGPFVRTIEGYVREYNESFRYQFVERDDLEASELAILRLGPEILTLVADPSDGLPPIRISETLRMTVDDTDGVWDPELGAIVVKRSQLRSSGAFAGTILHEFAHATSGCVDATRAFESVLTRYLGRTACAAVGREA